MIVKKAVLFGEYDERNMTKRMFATFGKNCGRARGGYLNYTCLPGTKCLDYHIYHIMLWTPEQVI